MVRELKISEARKHPANFLYIFADEKAFLQRIPAEYANVIRGKKANQNKLLMLSAQKYKSTYDEYKEAVRSGFMDIYGMTPAQALVNLASGKDVAGKNWSKGVYGVGALKQTSFAGTGYSVDPTTGTILDNGVPTATEKTIYRDVNGKTVPFQIYAYDNTTDTMYMSQLDEATGKYYATTKTNDKTGEMFNALGKSVTTSDSASMWENIIMCVGNFLAWLISLFSGGTTTLTEENTLPDQSADGFVTEAGIGEAGAILLALAAGGALLVSGSKKKATK